MTAHTDQRLRHHGEALIKLGNIYVDQGKLPNAINRDEQRMCPDQPTSQEPSMPH